MPHSRSTAGNLRIVFDNIGVAAGQAAASGLGDRGLGDRDEDVAARTPLRLVSSIEVFVFSWMTAMKRSCVQGRLRSSGELDLSPGGI